METVYDYNKEAKTCVRSTSIARTIQKLRYCVTETCGSNIVNADLSIKSDERCRNSQYWYGSLYIIAIINKCT